MDSPLLNKSLDELWQLFPVILSRHQDQWDDWYFEQKQAILAVCSGIQRISHIGSTAVPGLAAKPVIDILLEMDAGRSLEECTAPLLESGWICMSKQPEQISFNKGYTPTGFAQRVFHLHVRRAGDPDELYFRDLLIEHPETAAQYETLKLELQKQYEHDRNAYTAAKTEFVHSALTLARTEYGNRYDIRQLRTVRKKRRLK